MSLPRLIAFYAARTRSSLTRCVDLAILAAFALITTGCGDLDVVTAAYATRAEAEQAGAVARGWVPAAVPSGAHDLRDRMRHSRAHRVVAGASKRHFGCGPHQSRRPAAVPGEAAGVDRYRELEAGARVLLEPVRVWHGRVCQSSVVDSGSVS
jgi:hypothetical protein